MTLLQAAADRRVWVPVPDSMTIKNSHSQIVTHGTCVLAGWMQPHTNVLLMIIMLCITPERQVPVLGILVIAPSDCPNSNREHS